MNDLEKRRFEMSQSVLMKSAPMSWQANKDYVKTLNEKILQNEKEDLLIFKVAIEFARQHYNLPKELSDIFRKLVPETIVFSREGFLKEVFGEVRVEDE